MIQNFENSRVRSLISAYAIIEKKGKILLVEEEEKSGWKLPGGVIEKGEFLLDTLKREVKEETGHEIEPTTIVSIQEHIKKDKVHRIRFYFMAKLVGGKEAKLKGEIKKLAWLDKAKVKSFSETDFWKKQYYLALKDYFAGKTFPISLLNILGYRD